MNGLLMVKDYKKGSRKRLRKKIILDNRHQHIVELT